MKGMLKPLLGHFLNDFMRRILERSYSMIDFRTNPGPTSSSHIGRNHRGHSPPGEALCVAHRAFHIKK
jgi:hypothetical protein